VSKTKLLEAYLARLYADPAECDRFLDDPRGTAARAGLGAEEIHALEHIDRTGLRLASGSFAKKRALRSDRDGLVGWCVRLFARR
jgi:hypothetical protein